MDIHPASPAAYQLLHRGALALAEVEHAGMRIDLEYLDRTITETEQRIARIEEKLKEHDEYKLQRKRYGLETNLTSRDQLATVLFKDMGHECHSWTSGGSTKKRKPQLDEEALQRIDSHYTRGFLKLEKLNKLLGTYLRGVRREVEPDGLMHPFFNLHTVQTYRGSGSDINFQNIPVRDPEIGGVIRRAFIPRDGHVLVEIDYGQIEVRVACCLSGDQKLTYDTLHGDMHRDMAAECYLLEQDDVSKPLRGAAKGGFVFAEFYGDWHKQVAKNLWSAIDQQTKSGTVVRDHLATKGIEELGDCDPKEKARRGTFEDHIRQVEDRFWNERFSVYHRWRQDRVKQYRSRGWFELVTGFICSGIYSKNQVINFPIQGPAFHCLLWSLTELVRRMKRKKMRSMVIGQIHDSIVADIHKDELDDYVEMAIEITTKAIVEAWDWITVPLAVEVESSETNWFEKKQYQKTENKVVCLACGGTGKNSRGGDCVPCKRRPKVTV